ncbi:MAG: methyl-accepting chemotaxis protein [Mobilitalea sp.]
MKEKSAKDNSTKDTSVKVKKSLQNTSKEKRGEKRKVKQESSLKNLTNHGRKMTHILSNFGGSIRAKLILSFLIPVAFIIILGVAAYTSASKSIVSIFTNSTINVINSTGSYYDVIMQNITGKALELAVDKEVKTYYEGKLKDDKLEESDVYKSISNRVSVLAIADKYIENATIFTSYGYPISSYGSFTDTNPYETFSATGEAVLITDDIWTGYHSYVDEQLGIENSKYAISLSKQYLSSSSKPKGFIILDIPMSIVTDALSSMDLPDNSKVAFISSDGREITSEGNSEKSIFFGQPFYKDAVGNMAVNNDATDVTYEDTDHMFIFSKIGETGAMVAALVPSSEITKKADSIKSLALIIVLIATVIASFIGIIVASGIGRTIKGIIGTLEKAAGGDLTVTVKTKRKDEFLILSNSINHMIINVKNLITKASSVGETVINSTQNVAQNSELLLAASKDITSAISEIQQGIIQQATDAEQCLHQTDQLANQINIVYDNSVAIEKITTNTKNIVTDGIGVVDQLNNATKASIQITNETIKDIEELEDESRAITEIIGVINDIAEQTNLLSLNASIEAARAGDAGRGFSVVADEIRKLSIKSVNSASEIEKIINNISRKTQHTVKTVKQAESISKTTEARLANVVQLFNNINIHVDDLANKMINIAEGINDIDKAKNDTLNAIESISAVAEETSAASQEVDATAQQQLEAVTRLHEAAKSLDNDASDLQTAIRLFKID